MKKKTKILLIVATAVLVILAVIYFLVFRPANIKPFTFHLIPFKPLPLIQHLPGLILSR